MELEFGNTYHLYNRSNNCEIVFKEPDNYPYFMKRFSDHLADYLELHAYCLMPTHFHFLVSVKSNKMREAQDRIGIWLSSYTKAINKRTKRHGSLFQQHSKTRWIDDDRYLMTVLTYIHQNPVRAGLVNAVHEWPHSSIHALTEPSVAPSVSRRIVNDHFGTVTDFLQFSEMRLPTIDAKYWV